MKVKPMTIITLCLVPEEQANRKMSESVGTVVEKALSGLGHVIVQETLVRYDDPRLAASGTPVRMPASSQWVSKDTNGARRHSEWVVVGRHQSRVTIVCTKTGGIWSEGDELTNDEDSHLEWLERKDS